MNLKEYLDKKEQLNKKAEKVNSFIKPLEENLDFLHRVEEHNIEKFKLSNIEFFNFIFFLPGDFLVSEGANFVWSCNYEDTLLKKLSLLSLQEIKISIGKEIEILTFEWIDDYDKDWSVQLSLPLSWFEVDNPIDSLKNKFDLWEAGETKKREEFLESKIKVLREELTGSKNRFKPDTTKEKIQVTQKNIEKGLKNNFFSCPLVLILIEIKNLILVSLRI